MAAALRGCGKAFAAKAIHLGSGDDSFKIPGAVVFNQVLPNRSVGDVQLEDLHKEDHMDELQKQARLCCA